MKNYIISFWGIVFIDNAPFVGFLPQKNACDYELLYNLLQII